MTGNLQIICTSNMVMQTKEKASAMFSKIGLEKYEFKKESRYWKNSIFSVISCDFQTASLNLKKLEEELVYISGVKQAIVSHSDKDYEICCYNNLQTMVENHDLLFVTCYIQDR